MLCLDCDASNFMIFFRDEVETKLVAEVQQLRDNVSVLQEMLSEVCST
jgi:hypothetical protein